MNPLDLIPTMDLIAELIRRHDSAVIVLMRHGEAELESYTVTRRWHGHPHVCAGLAMDMTHYILVDLHAHKEPADGECA